VILGEIILAIFLFLSLSSQPVLIPIGNSMFPTIQPGDIVIYKRISSLEEVEVGERSVAH
jgi:signal peptidase I